LALEVSMVPVALEYQALGKETENFVCDSIVMRETLARTPCCLLDRW